MRPFSTEAQNHKVQCKLDFMILFFMILCSSAPNQRASSACNAVAVA
jgi:hypothetical protein